jgi:glycosyltransferase involved in cell wall biosynthesis
VEVSIVIPCLNEADTIGMCVGKALHALEEAGLSGEVVVADNGSSDGSGRIAADRGARVVQVERKGYGEALMGGIAAARGRYVMMGDADDSYDFGEVGRFVEKLRQGFDLVQGCRMPSGGGRIMPGAMPPLHRHVGNPLFSFLARWWFHVDIHDINCGMRAFTRELYGRLDQRCTGMEFAVEMVLKARLLDARIAETPITLRRDGRKSRTPHLRTFRDGWRTLRFFLLYSPRWLFLIPGVIAIALGVVGYALGFPRVSVHGVTFDEDTLLFASLALLVGWQSILFAVLAKTFAIGAGLLPADRRITRFTEVVSLERGIAFGCAGLIIGLVLLGGAVNQWRLANFGLLDYKRTLRWVIPGATLTALGFQTVLSSFLSGILRLGRR